MTLLYKKRYNIIILQCYSIVNIIVCKYYNIKI